MTKRIVTFPHMGNYSVAAKPAALLFGDEVLVPPRITKRTLELGAKYSPESACIPFKYSLGNFIEALDNGANVIVQFGGGCRMGYYGEVQKSILKKIGYDFGFVKLTNNLNLVSIARNIKQINPQHSYWHIAKTLTLTYEKALAIEDIERLVRLNVGFEVRPGSFEALFEQFLAAIDRVSTVKAVWDTRREFEAAFAALPINKPDHPLRVGIVGEIYVVMEPFSNFFIEKELAHYGIEVHRFITITGILRNAFAYNKHVKHLLADAAPYLCHAIGADGTESVARAHRLARDGFAGVLHIKPFGCMPEINAMPALQRISQDYHFPILYFSFDALTSEVGIKTRLEAFYDMLTMKEVNHEQLA